MLYPDAELRNADWPKRTKDRFADLQSPDTMESYDLAGFTKEEMLHGMLAELQDGVSNVKDALKAMNDDLEAMGSEWRVIQADSGEFKAVRKDS